MQDPYSSMNNSQHSSNVHMQFTMNQSLSTASISPDAGNSDFYMGLQFGSAYGNVDMYQSMSVPQMAQIYLPIPVSMPTLQDPMNRECVASATNHTSNTIASPQDIYTTVLSEITSTTQMLDMSSPGPFSNRLSFSSDGQSDALRGYVLNVSSPLDKNIITDSSDNCSSVSGNDEDPCTSSMKRQCSNGEPRDDDYREKRKKNNESAKRSRDARRTKVEQTEERVALLERENMQLRVLRDTLKHDVDRLRGLLDQNF